MELIDLQKEYRYHNRKYWKGRLPKEVVIEWSDLLPDPDCLGGTYVHGSHLPWPRNCGPRPKVHTIRLRRYLMGMDCIAAMTLLHEMAHLEAALGNQHLLYHGEHFHKKMKWLAKNNAFNAFW
jgi:hypothetical protein